jgi:hypothetical protein
MVMRPSSPERQCSSSARKLAIARLATGVHGVIGLHAIDGMRGAISVCECAADGTGAPPEWLAHRPPEWLAHHNELLDVVTPLIYC